MHACVRLLMIHPNSSSRDNIPVDMYKADDIEYRHQDFLFNTTNLARSSTYSSHDAVIAVPLRRSRGPAPGDGFTEITLTGRRVVDPIDTVLLKKVPNINKISALVHGLNRAADVRESSTCECVSEGYESKYITTRMHEMGRSGTLTDKGLCTRHIHTFSASYGSGPCMPYK